MASGSVETLPSRITESTGKTIVVSFPALLAMGSLLLRQCNFSQGVLFCRAYKTILWPVLNKESGRF